MIHFVDTEADWEGAMNTPFLDYVKELKDPAITAATPGRVRQ